jgi:transposase
MTRTAKAHAGQSFARLQSVPGIGQILALVLLYEIQDLARFPRVPDVVSACRLVQGAKESNHKRLGTSGKKIGNGPLRGALAEAAVLFLRQNHPGKADFAKLQHHPGNAKAWPVLGHQRARRVLPAHARTAVRPPTLCCRLTPGGRDGACRLTDQQRGEPARYSFLPYSLDCAGTAGPTARSPCG